MDVRDTRYRESFFLKGPGSWRLLFCSVENSSNILSLRLMLLLFKWRHIAVILRVISKLEILRELLDIERVLGVPLLLSPLARSTIGQR